MTQIKDRPEEEAPPFLYLDPFSAFSGYAFVYARTLDNPAERPNPRGASRAGSGPSCPFQWSPSGKETRPGEWPEAETGEIAKPSSQPWVARLWSRYCAWRDRRRALEAWERLDERTLRDITVTPDEGDDCARSATLSYRWYDTVL